MTNLSPAAQAVLTAYNETYESDRHAVAAALRAVADQLHPDLLGIMGDFYSVQSQLLAIAAELEKQ